MSCNEKQKKQLSLKIEEEKMPITRALVTHKNNTQPPRVRLGNSAIAHCVNNSSGGEHES